MNIQKLNLSIATIAILATQTFAGVTTATIDANDCGVPLALPHTYKISTEYLGRYDFIRPIHNFSMTLSLSAPTTVSDATLEITFPSYVSHAGITNATNIMDNTVGPTKGNIILNHSNTVGPVEVFDALASVDLVTGHTYCITAATGNNSANTCLDLPFQVNESTTTGDTTAVIDWKVYSNSGTAQLRDEGTLPLAYDVIPQFSINCISKLDGLINWENGKKSFVANKHGVDAVAAGIGAVDVQTTVQDTLIFAVNNVGGFTQAGVCNSVFDTWLDGNDTRFDVKSDVNLSVANWAFDLTSTTAGVTDAAAGTSALQADLQTVRFLTDTQPIFTGKTEYLATYNHTPGYGAPTPGVIPETTFSGAVDLEADGTLAVVPAISSSDPKNLGQWQNHAYIAQIAGMTDGAQVKSKVFIVNRSCSAATPTISLIQNGNISVYTANTALDVDKQAVYKLGDIKAENGFTLKSGPSLKTVEGLFAVELAISGVAEDFYVYAQALHLTKDQFKDLPVYNTSTRD